MVIFHGEPLNNQMVRENPTKMDEYIHSPSYPQSQEDQIKQLRDVFMMIDGNGDGTDRRKNAFFDTRRWSVGGLICQFFHNHVVQDFHHRIGEIEHILANI